MINQPKKIDTNLLVLVSNQLIGPEGVPVGFAFRTEATNKQDSGWNFWSGEETEDFVKNSANFAKHPLHHFTSLDESLHEIIDAEVGTAWERDPDTDSWIESEDES